MIRLRLVGRSLGDPDAAEPDIDPPGRALEHLRSCTLLPGCRVEPEHLRRSVKGGVHVVARHLQFLPAAREVAHASCPAGFRRDADEPRVGTDQRPDPVAGGGDAGGPPAHPYKPYLGTAGSSGRCGRRDLRRRSLRIRLATREAGYRDRGAGRRPQRRRRATPTSACAAGRRWWRSAKRHRAPPRRPRPPARDRAPVGPSRRRPPPAKIARRGIAIRRPLGHRARDHGVELRAGVRAMRARRRRRLVHVRPELRLVGVAPANGTRPVSA